MSGLSLGYNFLTMQLVPANQTTSLTGGPGPCTGLPRALCSGPSSSLVMTGACAIDCPGSGIVSSLMFLPLFYSGHQSFSNNRSLNDLVGNIVHSSILVPYHGWRISHRTHHANHGHVENDESWHPVAKGIFDKMEFWAKIGRLTLPWALFAYPFYLWQRSPGKEGSHYDPSCDLFVPAEKNMVRPTHGLNHGYHA